MVISGTMHVTANDNGPPVMDTTFSITVEARDPSALGYFEYDAPTTGEITADPPPIPDSLGTAVPNPKLASTYGWLDGTGPNDGYRAWSGFPLGLTFRIRLNEGQFQEGSYLWNETPPIVSPPTCTRSFIADHGDLRAAIRAHEMGHVQAWKDDLEARRSSVQEKAEMTVFPGFEPGGLEPTFEHLVGQEFDPWYQQVGDDYDANHPAQLGCNLAAFGGTT